MHSGLSCSCIYSHRFHSSSWKYLSTFAFSLEVVATSLFLLSLLLFSIGKLHLETASGFTLLFSFWKLRLESDSGILIPSSSARSSSSQSDEKSFVDLFSSEVLPIFILLIWRPTLLSASAERDAFPASFVLLMFGLVAAFGTSVPSLFSEAAAACWAWSTITASSALLTYLWHIIGISSSNSAHYIGLISTNIDLSVINRVNR